MAITLKMLEPYVKNATHLQTGKPFQNFGEMRSREALANWLLCATANAIDGRNLSIASTTDPMGGDGIIHDEDTGESFPTEHVMVPRQSGGADTDIQALILKAIDDKRVKGGTAYASGKTLVVFVNAGAGEWYPNRVARALPGPLYFATVWVVSLQSETDGAYSYNVVHLDSSQANAPAYRVHIAKDFDDWQVEVVQ
ncbi:hypothetical protein JIR23_29845 [Bradyrhizobium diazoefficiens]|nr:hypothetical protein [Bradyrhizobium diazoefficiens]QQN63665.1 hypothetical protein JIR23_29845 [Bradyrhizobium diazoefficiens]